MVLIDKRIMISLRNQGHFENG